MTGLLSDYCIDAYPKGAGKGFIANKRLGILKDVASATDLDSNNA
jgi:hypothetical protein